MAVPFSSLPYFSGSLIGTEIIPIVATGSVGLSNYRISLNDILTFVTSSIVGSEVTNPLTSDLYLGGYDIISVNGILDESGQTAFDVSNRRFYDRAGSESLDLNQRSLFDSQGNSVVEWVGQGLGGEGGYTGGIIFQPTFGVGLCSVVNWPGVPSCSVDANFFYLNDVGGNSTVDWNGKLLLGNWGVFGTFVDGTQATTVDINNRTLYATDGVTPLLNWSGSYAQANTFAIGAIKGTYPLAPYDYTAFDVNNRVLHDGNNVPVINFQANSAGGDTGSLLTVDSNANQVTVNSARFIVNGYIQSPTGSFDVVNATSYTGDGSQLTGITVSNSKVPINLAYNPVVVIDPSQGSYFKCILNGDVEFQTATGGIQDGQEVNLMVIAAGAGSAMTLTGVQIGTDSTYTNPKALTSFLLYIIDLKWSNDAGAWCLTSISGGFNGY